MAFDMCPEFIFKEGHRAEYRLIGRRCELAVRSIPHGDEQRLDEIQVIQIPAARDDSVQGFLESLDPDQAGGAFPAGNEPSNSAKYLATSTMHTPSSMATSAPVSFSKYTSAR